MRPTLGWEFSVFEEPSVELSSVADVQQLYRQWQDGKLLDNDERKALRTDPGIGDMSSAGFPEILKSASDGSSAGA